MPRQSTVHAIALLAIALATVGFTGASTPRFRLAPTSKAPRAVGWVQLTPAVSPFAVSVSRDGRLEYDLDITAHDLPPVGWLGAYTGYVAWLASPNLEVVRRLGAIGNDSTIHATADWNKFTVIVTAEPAKVGQKWSGAVVLVGRSPSSLMQSFADHPFYNTGTPF
jgi:hypothetical protein